MTVIPFQVIDCYPVALFHVVGVVAVVSVLLFHALTVILFHVIAVVSVMTVMTVIAVILFHVLICFDCFTDSILMIIVKKIQIPNIFFTFSKKYY